MEMVPLVWDVPLSTKQKMRQEVFSFIIHIGLENIYMYDKRIQNQMVDLPLVMFLQLCYLGMPR